MMARFSAEVTITCRAALLPIVSTKRAFVIVPTILLEQ